MAQIQSLALYDWRSYDEKIFHFDASSVIFYGNNGVGKTNILEAIALLSVGKSWRTSKNIDLIKESSPSSKIDILTNKNDQYTLLLEPTKKQFLKNEKKEPFKKHLGQLPTLLFAPEQLTLFVGTKKQRRSLFDRLLCQLSFEYQSSLLKYEKAVKQRNALLKEEFLSTENIHPWEHIISEEIPFIGKMRKQLAKDINPLLQKAFSALSQSDEPVTLTLLETESHLTTPTTVREHFEQIRQREHAAQRTLIGPHRDDWGFSLREKKVTATASRGEERSLLLALLDAQKHILQERLDQKPILLLDDVFSELDEHRQKHLAALCQDTQVFFTTTHKEHFKGFKDVQGIEIV